MSQSQLYEWIKFSDKKPPKSDVYFIRKQTGLATGDINLARYFDLVATDYEFFHEYEWLSPVSTDWGKLESELIKDAGTESLHKVDGFKVFHWIKQHLVSSDNKDEAASVATLVSRFGIPIWLSEKPDFDKECVLVTATKYVRNNEPLHWGYSVWQIKKLDGETETGEYGWYYGLLNGDGEEWGPLEDLSADRYLILGESNLSSTIPCTVGNNIEQGLHHIESVCNIGIPYYAYGDNEAACQMAQVINEVRETAQALLTSPASKKDIEHD